MNRLLRLFAKDEDGNVVIYIAGALLILGFIAADLLHAARRDLRTNQAAFERLELENASEAGARLGAALADAVQPDEVVVQYLDCQYGPGDLAITIRPVTGLFDVNSGRIEDLNILLQALSVDEKTLSRVLAAYRAKTELVNHPEAETNNPSLVFPQPYFNQIGDFRYLDGVSDALFEQLRYYLTAESYLSQMQFHFAPEPLKTFVEETYGPSRLNPSQQARSLDKLALQIVSSAYERSSLQHSQIFVMSEPVSVDGARLILDDFQAPEVGRARLTDQGMTPLPPCLELIQPG